MSFSSAVKNGLCRLEVNNTCCMLAELASVIRISGTVKLLGNNTQNVRIVTENAAFARKVFSTVKKLYNIYPEVIIRKSLKLKKHVSYILILTASMGTRKILDDIGITNKNGDITEVGKHPLFSKKILKKVCCRRNCLRGAFLAGGSISDPEKTYHLEITTHSLYLAREINGLIKSFNLNARIVKRKENYVVYLKEGENIVDFLNIIGAHSALLELENVRILKGMRNNVNRIVNCETANLDKTVNASLRQIENIKYIRDNAGFDSLSANLRETAVLRLAYDNASLKELGEMSNPALGKSGVNHRLRKLDKIAEDIKKIKSG